MRIYANEDTWLMDWWHTIYLRRRNRSTLQMIMSMIHGFIVSRLSNHRFWDYRLVIHFNNRDPFIYFFCVFCVSVGIQCHKDVANKELFQGIDINNENARSKSIRLSTPRDRKMTGDAFHILAWTILLSLLKGVALEFTPLKWIQRYLSADWIVLIKWTCQRRKL